MPAHACHHKKDARSLTLQRKVRLKAAVPGGVLLENACAGESAQNGYGAGSNLAL
jgi:hypothetical protein